MSKPIEGKDKKTTVWAPKSLNICGAGKRPQAMLLLGQFIRTSLSEGRPATIVSYDHPNTLIENMNQYNFDFTKELNKGRLTYLYFKWGFSRQISIERNYLKFFQEVEDLSERKSHRVAFLNVESLIMGPSQSLMCSNLIQLAAASQRLPFTALGIFIKSEDEIGKFLNTAGEKYFPNFFDYSELGVVKREGSGPIDFENSQEEKISESMETAASQ